MKLCKDCKHLWMAKAVTFETPMCRNVIDPVDGTKGGGEAHRERREGACGYEARNFEAKP